MAASKNIIKYKDTAPTAAFTVLGISSHENDYRLSWNFNDDLGFKFAKTIDNIETHDGKEFNCFVHQDDDQRLLLVSNLCDKGYLLNKYKNLDFILKFDYELDEAEITKWIKKLRKVTLVSAAFIIHPDKKVMQLLDSMNNF